MIQKNKKENESCDLSYFVGLSIEIYNRFIEDYRLVIDFAKWKK